MAWKCKIASIFRQESKVTRTGIRRKQRQPAGNHSSVGFVVQCGPGFPRLRGERGIDFRGMGPIPLKQTAQHVLTGSQCQLTAPLAVASPSSPLSPLARRPGHRIGLPYHSLVRIWADGGAGKGVVCFCLQVSSPLGRPEGLVQASRWKRNWNSARLHETGYANLPRWRSAKRGTNTHAHTNTNARHLDHQRFTATAIPSHPTRTLHIDQSLAWCCLLVVAT